MWQLIILALQALLAYLAHKYSPEGQKKAAYVERQKARMALDKALAQASDPGNPDTSGLTRWFAERLRR